MELLIGNLLIVDYGLSIGDLAISDWRLAPEPMPSNHGMTYAAHQQLLREIVTVKRPFVNPPIGNLSINNLSIGNLSIGNLSIGTLSISNPSFANPQ